MRGMAKAFYVWQSPSRGETKKPIEYVHTKDGRTIERGEWLRICLEMITQADLRPLLEQIEEYVQRNCLWVKNGELEEYSMDCLLKGSYKHWDDFIYQERLMLDANRIN